MAGTPYMPLYVGDYLADTAHLSAAEHGAYLLLLMAYWRNGGPLPDDDRKLARICQMDLRQWKKARETVLSFFTPIDDETGVMERKFAHTRVDHELQVANDKYLKKRKAGLARAKQRYSTEGSSAKLTRTRTRTIGIDQEDRSHLNREVSPLQHGSLVFAGRVIRLNARDFDQWESAYSAIPDLRAELTALDDWLRDHDDPAKAKNWFRVVSGALAKKHQKFHAEKRDDGDEMEGFIC